MPATESPPLDAPSPPLMPSVMPARRRRRILAALWVVFALWVATLLTMYFATVYPQRHPHDGRPAVIVPPAR